MKDKDLLVLGKASSSTSVGQPYESSYYRNQRAGKSLLKNLKGISKKSNYPEGKPYCSRIELTL